MHNTLVTTSPSKIGVFYSVSSSRLITDALSYLGTEIIILTITDLEFVHIFVLTFTFLWSFSCVLQSSQFFQNSSNEEKSFIINSDPELHTGRETDDVLL